MKKKSLIFLVKKHYTNPITDVCIIGGGPVGMTIAALLAQKNINSIILEKDSSISIHPKAHYISPRTVEILNYIGFREYIEKYRNESTKDYDNWRYYRYCQYIIDKDDYYGEIDHFEKNQTLSMEEINDISNAEPMHIGQNKINQALYQFLTEKYKKKEENKGCVEFKFNSEFINFSINPNKKNFNIDYYYDINFKEKGKDKSIYTPNTNSNLRCKYILGCDGAHSKVRQSIGSNLIGEKEMQNFINAHFISKKLAQKLKEIKKESMLHFIFNRKYICVLITYDLDVGEFVLQIPYFPKIGQKENYDEKLCKSILLELLSKNKIDDDIEYDIKFIDVNFWKMRNVIADKWYKDNCFLLGDSAHQFPPSGGYGLNTGISDAFSLGWRLEYLLKSPQNFDFLKDEFNRERILHSTFVSKCAKINYDKFLKCTDKIGLNINNAKQLEFLVSNLFPKNIQYNIFNNCMKAGIFMSNIIFIQKLKDHLQKRDSYINLVFPYLDYGLNFIDKEKNDIKKYDVFYKPQYFIENLKSGKIFPNLSFELCNLPYTYLNTARNIIPAREFFNLLNKDSYHYFLIFKNSKDSLTNFFFNHKKTRDFSNIIQDDFTLCEKLLKIILIQENNEKRITNATIENLLDEIEVVDILKKVVLSNLSKKSFVEIRLSQNINKQNMNFDYLLLRPDFIIEDMN